MALVGPAELARLRQFRPTLLFQPYVVEAYEARMH